MNWVRELVSWITSISGGDPVMASLIASTIAALLTGIGAALVIPLFFANRLESTESVSRLLDMGLGFSSGVMVVASFTSLLLPAIDSAGFTIPAIGFIVGALTIHVVNRLLPHEHLFKGYEGPSRLKGKIRASWLVMMAIVIHNLPEGMAIGSSIAYSIAAGTVTAIAIAVQDMPEGFAVALPIAIARKNPWLGVALGILSGFSEVALAVPVAAIGAAASGLLPFILGFGAGAMIYVVSHEALPESHRTGYEAEATLGFFAGFLIMLYLDTMLG